MTVFGIDISHFQWDAGQIDLEVVAAKSDTKFVMVKMSEGKSFVDPQFERLRAQAQRAGLLFAAYHYLRGDSTPEQQASWVKQIVGGRDFPVFIDIERTDATPQPVMADARDFRSAADDLGVLVSDLLYLPEWYWDEIGRPDVSKWPLWQSDYGPNDGKYPGDGSSRWNWGTRKARILQFTSKGRVPGYSGDIDRDAYPGSRGELASEGWFKDYQEEEVTPEEIQTAVARTPIVVDAEGTTQPLQQVLRRILNAKSADPDAIAKAVVAALPPGARSDGKLTSMDVQKAVAAVLTKGTDDL